MNITKKLLIVFFIVISILSTAFLYKANAEQEYEGTYGDENNGFKFHEKEIHMGGFYEGDYAVGQRRYTV